MEGFIMKVKCIDIENCNNLSIGKEYNVLDEGEKYYVITDNVGNEIVTKKQRFIVVEDAEREKKAKAIITELTFQIGNELKDIKDIKIRKNSRGEIKEINIKFKY
jgi:hypothetical protein